MRVCSFGFRGGFEQGPPEPRDRLVAADGPNDLKWMLQVAHITGIRMTIRRTRAGKWYK